MQTWKNKNENDWDSRTNCGYIMDSLSNLSSKMILTNTRYSTSHCAEIIKALIISRCSMWLIIAGWSRILNGSIQNEKVDFTRKLNGSKEIHSSGSHEEKNKSATKQNISHSENISLCYFFMFLPMFACYLFLFFTFWFSSWCFCCQSPFFHWIKFLVLVLLLIIKET